jgi:hypothetical protein
VKPIVILICDSPSMAAVICNLAFWVVDFWGTVVVAL